MSNNAAQPGGLDSLKEGQRIETEALLLTRQLAQTKSGKTYATVRLGDANAQVEGKIWDMAEEWLSPLSPGQVVRVVGRVESYKGLPQINITEIRSLPDVDLVAFLPQSPAPFAELEARFEKLLKKVKHPGLNRLLRHIFRDIYLDFSRIPAAKQAHHAYVHGLMEHTVSVSELALHIGGHYPHLNRDLLLAGALLHDIGKVQEFSLTPPFDYTDAGRLEGHLILGLRMLDEALRIFPNFPEDYAQALRHMMISHHGQEEFGSPQKPKTSEALMLHFLDDMDAKANMFLEAQAAEPDGLWSRFHGLLERHIYLKNFNQPEEKSSPQPAPLGPGLFDQEES